MNVGKKKADWVMADGTKYTAKKAAALTRLAKREKEGGKEKDEDEDDNNNDGGAGSDGRSSNSSSNGGSSNRGSSNGSNSNGSSTVAAEATKAFVKMMTATETTTNGGTAQILPGKWALKKNKRSEKATKNKHLIRCHLFLSE